MNGPLNAFVTVTAELARAEARRAEAAVMRGGPLGRLHGVPFSVKDTLDTAGVRTTMGAVRFADRVPAEDAVVVARLRAAGAILVGKTTTPEFAHKGVTDSALSGVTRNPWALDHTCGGSSGGAAVAAATGMGPLAVGTDEGGSIRIPASYCGVVGLKPTFGLIPRVPVGVAELLTHLGPLCRTVEDAALFLSVTAGRDDRDGWSLPVEPADYTRALARPPARLRVAWSPRLGYARVDPEVVRVVGAAARGLAALGWTVEEADPGFDDPAEVADAFRYPGLAAAIGDDLEQDARAHGPEPGRARRGRPPDDGGAGRPSGRSSPRAVGAARSLLRAPRCAGDARGGGAAVRASASPRRARSTATPSARGAGSRSRIPSTSPAFRPSSFPPGGRPPACRWACSSWAAGSTTLGSSAPRRRSRLRRRGRTAGRRSIPP